MSITQIVCALCFFCFIPLSRANTLINQSALEPDPSNGLVDHGVYSVRNQAAGDNDPLESIAYDNFSLCSTSFLSSISWTGIYSEPLPSLPSRTDFTISIWSDQNGAPNANAEPILRWELDGGLAGESGPDISVLPNGDVNEMTEYTFGGGAGFDYQASISGHLPSGEYWISIQALQRFDNPSPTIDPEWQWHFGSGLEDGFFSEDKPLDRPLSKTPGRDLAFSLRGTIGETGPNLAILTITNAEVSLHVSNAENSDYQLQTSQNLDSWTDAGDPFRPDASGEAIVTIPYDRSSGFFRMVFSE